MKKVLSILLSVVLLTILLANNVNAQQKLDEKLPVRGLCIAAPPSAILDRFVKFIDEDLSKMNVNVLVLRVDYGYEYKSHPELANSTALSKQEVKKLVEVCRKNKIKLIPQINLLGHQSWASKTTNLLVKYPQFDETPHIKMPKKYKWPNADSLYCKSYCPLHPEVHSIVFALVDEIIEVFETDAFHAGLDEVFYIGDDKCPRCSGKNKAKLFADEVSKIRDHLATKNCKLWMWGDRLIDGYSTGMGMWEASQNGTAPAIELIPKDIMICDWHYERPDPTAVYFAMKGFDVVTCPYKNPEIAKKQLKDIVTFRENSTPKMKEHFKGMMQTVWSGAESFLDDYYGAKKKKQKNNSANCFKELFEQINEL